MATSFTVNYPASVGTNWRFSVATVGSDIVIAGTLGSFVPTFYLLGF